MSRTIRLFLSGLTSGIIAAGTGLVSALGSIDSSTPFDEVSWTVWAGILVGGLLASAKDWRTYLAEPPDGH